MNAADQRQQVVDALDAIKKTARDPYATFPQPVSSTPRSGNSGNTRRRPCHHPGLVPAGAAGGGIDEMTECEERLMVSRRIFLAGVSRDVHRAGGSNGERPERVCWR